MDKQLIQRLAREAGMPLVTPYQATEAESAARHNERILGIAERFATLVAEECAKIADEHRDDAQDAPYKDYENNHPDGYTDAGNDIAAAIREEFGPASDLTALAEEIAADDGTLPAGFKGAGPNNFTFRSPPPWDWRREMLTAIRAHARYSGGLPMKMVTVCGRKANGEKTRYEFDRAWVNAASDEDILRAIDASEAPR
jgi:hypothetical protein